jgi:hypothetical protein
MEEAYWFSFEDYLALLKLSRETVYQRFDIKFQWALSKEGYRYQV